LKRISKEETKEDVVIKEFNEKQLWGSAVGEGRGMGYSPVHLRSTTFYTSGHIANLK